MKAFSIAFSYRDTKGKESKRIFDVRQVDRDEIGQLFYTGFCHLKKGIRTFRGDRMNAISSLKTGEVFDTQAELVQAITAEYPNLKIGLKKHHYSAGFVDEIATDPCRILSMAISAKIDADMGEQERLTTLLKDPLGEQMDNWAFCVPPIFNDALDMRITLRTTEKEPTPIWTQGSRFSFHKGDTIYDRKRHGETWADELREILMALQVNEAIAASPATKQTERDTGSVTFTIFKPNSTLSALEKVETRTATQDEFVKILIAGVAQHDDSVLGKKGQAQPTAEA